MKGQTSLVLKIFLGLFTLLGIIVYSPAPTKISAQTPTCAPVTAAPGTTPGAGKVRIQGGFLTSTSNLTLDFATNSNYICGNQAQVPVVSINDYQSIFSLYFTQSSTALTKREIPPGTQYQTTPESPINLTTLSN